MFGGMFKKFGKQMDNMGDDGQGNNSMGGMFGAMGGMIDQMAARAQKDMEKYDGNEVAWFLDQNNLGQYREVLCEDQGYESIEDLVALPQDEMEMLGVKRGHAMKILREAKNHLEFHGKNANAPEKPVQQPPMDSGAGGSGVKVQHDHHQHGQPLPAANEWPHGIDAFIAELDKATFKAKKREFIQKYRGTRVDAAGMIRILENVNYIDEQVEALRILGAQFQSASYPEQEELIAWGKRKFSKVKKACEKACGR